MSFQTVKAVAPTMHGPWCSKFKISWPFFVGVF